MFFLLIIGRKNMKDFVSDQLELIAIEEKKYHPQKRFKMLLDHLERQLQNEVAPSRVFSNLRFPLMISRENDGECQWDLILLNYSPNRDKSELFYLDCAGFLGECPTSQFEMTGKVATIEDLIRSFILLEISFVNQDKVFEEPFQALNTLLHNMEENKIPLKFSQKLQDEMEKSKSAWVARNKSAISPNIRRKIC